MCLIGQRSSGVGYVPKLTPIPVIMPGSLVKVLMCPVTLSAGRLRPLPPHDVAL